MNGSDETCVFEYENLRGEVKTFSMPFEGVLPMVRRRYREASSDMMRDQFAQFMTVKPCSTCHGTRLRHEALAIKIGGLNIAELTDLPIRDMIPFFRDLKLTEKQQLIGQQVFKEIKARFGLPPDRRPRLPDPVADGRDSVRRRSPANPPGHSDRLGLGRRPLYSR